MTLVFLELGRAEYIYIVGSSTKKKQDDNLVSPTLCSWVIFIEKHFYYKALSYL